MAFLGWTILGLVIAAGAVTLVSWVRVKQHRLRWYEVTLLVVGTLILVFTIEVFTGSLAELEPRAAVMALVFMGLPGLIVLGAGLGSVYRSIKRRGLATTPAVPTEAGA